MVPPVCSDTQGLSSKSTLATSDLTGLLPPAVQQLFIGQPAIAADVDAVAAPEAATSTASDAAAAATTMLEKDPVTTVLFTIAIGALSIVTLGVSGMKSD